MGIKFAMDIIKEIEKRGSITVPKGYVTGEAYEEWLYEEDVMDLKAQDDFLKGLVRNPISFS